MIGSMALLALVTSERVGELWLANRNTAVLLKRGAREHAAGHYPFIVILHACWLAGLWGFAWNQPLHLDWLLVFALLQILRIWTLATLRTRWTTRIITVPGEALVKRGPYRFVDHPNYAVVMGEIAVLPLVFGLWAFALLFSMFNAVILFVRIQAENRALAASR